jgi:hypothetical protein
MLIFTLILYYTELLSFITNIAQEPDLSFIKIWINDSGLGMFQKFYLF